MPRAPDRPVFSLHDAAVALLDSAAQTLTSKQDDASVHTARKACKQARAALRLLRECLGDEVYRRENQRVRDAAKPLTVVRDAFVLRRTLHTLPVRPAALQRRLTADYRREQHALQRRGARRAIQPILETRRRLAELPAMDSEVSSARAGVRRVYKAGRKAFRKARSRDDQALHEWRKQAKYLLNQLDLLKLVLKVKCKPLRRRTHRLTDALGTDHDLSALSHQLQRYAIHDPALQRHIKKRRGKLQAAAFQLGKKIYRHSAKHLEGALG
ncbi:MAG TPA: CHAD domain-containing protein [Steroidobacteraceae bacterium]|jgi:CHAD domain-containing protein